MHLRHGKGGTRPQNWSCGTTTLRQRAEVGLWGTESLGLWIPQVERGLPLTSCVVTAPHFLVALTASRSGNALSAGKMRGIEEEQSCRKSIGQFFSLLGCCGNRINRKAVHICGAKDLTRSKHG
jgi:hypothetical protein